MPKVNGVLGPIDTADLGFTLMHEHVMVATPAMRQAFPDWIDRDAVVANATTVLVAYDYQSKSSKEIPDEWRRRLAA